VSGVYAAGDALGVAGVPGVLRGLHLLARGRLVERWDGWAHRDLGRETRVRAPSRRHLRERVVDAVEPDGAGDERAEVEPALGGESSTFGMSVSGSVEPYTQPCSVRAKWNSSRG
jgi:hypothetical protein